MRQKRIFEAEVTVQGARINPSNLVSSRPTSTSNPLVHILVMVPKGKRDVTVPTNCVTDAVRRTLEPLWNQTFTIPVQPSSDVLVFNVINDTALVTRRRRHLAENADLPDDDVIVPNDSKSLVGLCLLPVAHFASSGAVTQHTLDILPRPNAASVGKLYIATRIKQVTIELLEKKDLADPLRMRTYHASRLSAVTERFLGIGELAAFLFEDRYSSNHDENWERAVTLLAEQLAYRIWETTESTDDQLNFAIARQKIEKDGGLWDGV